jgi:orotidine-5'-phosphate decarboxylase
MNDYSELLAARIRATGSALCVGIDPRLDTLGRETEALLNRLVDETAEFAAAFKPNMAYFEAEGSEGFALLERVIARVPKDVPVILDAKRGDIGATQEYYAKAYFERMDVAAVTLNAYMGFDAIEPFLKYPGKGVYLLAVTSNPGAVDLETQVLADGRQVFELVGDMRGRAISEGLPGDVGFVVGLTNATPEVLAAVPDGPLLVPGLGAQGGELAGLSGQARTAPVVINVSRGIFPGDPAKSFAEQAREFAEKIVAAL